MTKNKIEKKGMFLALRRESGRSPNRASRGGAQGINFVQILSPETESTM